LGEQDSDEPFASKPMSHHTVGGTGIGGQPCTPHPTKGSATIRKITATADQRQQCPISNLWGTRIRLMEVRGRRGVAIAEACDDSKHISSFKQDRPAWDRAHLDDCGDFADACPRFLDL